MFACFACYCVYSTAFVFFCFVGCVQVGYSLYAIAAFESYVNVRVFEQVCDLSDFWGVVCENIIQTLPRKQTNNGTTPRRIQSTHTTGNRHDEYVTNKNQ